VLILSSKLPSVKRHLNPSTKINYIYKKTINNYVIDWQAIQITIPKKELVKKEY
jgi:hypothetical protein